MKFKIQEKATSNVSIRWNRDRENSFCRKYRKRSKSLFQWRHQKLAQDFKKKVSSIYNIEALW